MSLSMCIVNCFIWPMMLNLPNFHFQLYVYSYIHSNELYYYVEMTAMVHQAYSLSTCTCILNWIELFFNNFFFLAKYCSSGAKKHAFAPPTSGHGSAAVLSTRCSQLDERSEAIKAIKEFTSHLTTPSQATPIHTSARKNRLTEYVVDRNTTAIINELSQNNDYKVR